MRQFDSVLRQLRELLHSHGRISSRNEALDELSVLVFAHAMGVQRDGMGISHVSLAEQPGRGTAEKLRSYVDELVRLRLPKSLAHEFNPGDFTLRLKPGESELAARIVTVFEGLTFGSQGDPLRVDVINEAFGRFIADSFVDEKELGQYLTPPEVVDFMVQLAVANLTDDERSGLMGDDPVRDFGYVLDPSCGVGSFLAEFIRFSHEHIGTSKSPIDNWPARAAERLIVGIDKSERMVRLALANLALFGAPTVRLHLANSLATHGTDAATAKSFDHSVGLILTNPPFGATFSYEDLTDYRIATSWPKRTPATVDSELLFLERYISWLRPGGQLLAVVPDSILTNKGLFADLRQGIRSSVDLLDIISLPSVTFAAAGTTTKTSVLHLRRKPTDAPKGSCTRFAICSDLGYTMSVRGSQRTKVSEGTNQLPGILKALTAGEVAFPAREVQEVTKLPRWDATYHASMSAAVESRLSGHGTRVGDVASLVNDRADPRKFSAATFKYVEISDVDGETYSVTYKEVLTSQAPSRARQMVRAGDLLVSTVRPERRSIGVVPEWLDGAVCTTGFAVLRPREIDSLLLAALLRAPFVTEQLMRNNIGIAYPAIEASCLPDVLLPISLDDCDSLGSMAAELSYAQAQLHAIRSKFDVSLEEHTKAWLRQVPNGLEIRKPDAVADDT